MIDDARPLHIKQNTPLPWLNFGEVIPVAACRIITAHPFRLDASFHLRQSHHFITRHLGICCSRNKTPEPNMYKLFHNRF
jgi:hypothetical protein